MRGEVVEGGAGAVARFVGDGAEAGLAAGDGDAFGQVTARGGGPLFSFAPSLPRAARVGGGARSVLVAAYLALVAGHFATLAPCRRGSHVVG